MHRHYGCHRPVCLSLSALLLLLLVAPVPYTAPTGDLDLNGTVNPVDIQCQVLIFAALIGNESPAGDLCSQDNDCGVPGYYPAYCRRGLTDKKQCLPGCLAPEVSLNQALGPDCPDPQADDDNCMGTVGRKVADLNCDGEFTVADLVAVVAIAMGKAGGPGTPDVDSDGQLNFCDADSDNDSLLDEDDPNPLEFDENNGDVSVALVLKALPAPVPPAIEPLLVTDLYAKEHVSLPAVVRTQLRLRDSLYQQVKVYRDDNGNGVLDVATEVSAAYTVVLEYDAETPEHLAEVYMGAAAKSRLGCGETEDCAIRVETNLVTNVSCHDPSRFADEWLHECIRYDPASYTGLEDLLVLALHGGSVEPGTDEIARRVVEGDDGAYLTVDDLKATAFGILGVYIPGASAYTRFHVTSKEIDNITASFATAANPDYHMSYPTLARLAGNKYGWVYSIHGFAEYSCGGVEHDATDGKIKSVVVEVGGGAAQALRIQLQTRLADALGAVKAPDHCVDVKVGSSEFAGINPSNPVNWFTENGNGGFQLELSWAARNNNDLAYRAVYRKAIAAALRDFYVQVLKL